MKTEDVSKLPNLQVKVGSSVFVLPPKNYMTKDPKSFSYYHGFKGLGAELKIGQVWALGYSFLKDYYSVYDYDNQMVCLALSVPDEDLATSESTVDPNDELLLLRSRRRF